MKPVLLTVTVGISAMLLALAAGAEPETPPPSASEPPDPDEVLDNLLQKRKEQPTIAPVQQPMLEADVPGAPVRASQYAVDERVLGTAPGLARPKLRREGEMIPLRRGRIIRSAGSSQVMFVFDADSPDAGEAPMFVMPCGALEHMENIVAERGDEMTFLLSGQVFAYRGANYLLPGLWKLPAVHGNLQ